MNLLLNHGALSVWSQRGRSLAFPIALLWGLWSSGPAQAIGMQSAIAPRHPRVIAFPRAPVTDRLGPLSQAPSALPFIGRRSFNFLGGSGTGQSITIEPDGTTTVERHGTANRAIEYRGRFSNPLWLNDQQGLLIEGSQIYQVGPDGQRPQNCDRGAAPCRAELWEITSEALAPAGLPASEPVEPLEDVEDGRFSRQPFNRSRFQQVQALNRACGFYDVTSPCSVRIYPFNNLSLIAQRNGTESVSYSLSFYRPISQVAALAYVRILNNNQAFRPIETQRLADRLVYYGCPYDAGEEQPAPLCSVELFYPTPSGPHAPIERSPNGEPLISGLRFIQSSP